MFVLTPDTGVVSYTDPADKVVCLGCHLSRTPRTVPVIIRQQNDQVYQNQENMLPVYPALRGQTAVTGDGKGEKLLLFDFVVHVKNKYRITDYLKSKQLLLFAFKIHNKHDKGNISNCVLFFNCFDLQLKVISSYSSTTSTELLPQFSTCSG